VVTGTGPDSRPGKPHGATTSNRTPRRVQEDAAQDIVAAIRLTDLKTDDARPNLARLRNFCSVLRPVDMPDALRSPKLQCESGRTALGSSKASLRTPVSAGHPSQSSTGRDSCCPVRVKGCDVQVNLAIEVASVHAKVASERARRDPHPRFSQNVNASTTIRAPSLTVALYPPAGGPKPG
jgi:hypothetical protein